MTTADLIVFLQKLPPGTPVCRLSDKLTYVPAEPKVEMMYRTVQGEYSRFWSKGQQHRNDTAVVILL